MDLQRAVSLGQGPSFDSTWPATLVHQFENIVPDFPQNVAVKEVDGASLTYTQLAQKVDMIALELLHHKVNQGCRICVLQEASGDWVASMLAVLKVGAVYVPLDPSTPVQRLSLIAGDCKPAAILIHHSTQKQATELETPSGTPRINVSRLTKPSFDPIEIIAQADAPAIILYTSGSTGTPKGVELQHAALKHEFDICAATYALEPSDVVLQQSAFSFDLSVTQMFIALSVGARLCMILHVMWVDAHAIVQCIEKEGVTITDATPTELKSWLRRDHRPILQGSAWRLALIAGEAVTEPLLQLFRKLDHPGLHLYNIYGPTETTCCVPVGRASANEAFYIVDEQLRLQPIGLPGEIVIGGVGVATGYLNNNQLTKAMFLANPFASPQFVNRGWQRMYRTGDRGRLLPDGTLLLGGRIQGGAEIKLHGVRIDLGDIEQTILRAADGQLADAAATLRSTADGTLPFMVAHVVLTSLDLPCTQEQFHNNLLANLPLPRPMRPSMLVSIEALPRTVSGKLDRKVIEALPLTRNMSGSVNAETLSSEHQQIHADSDFFNVGGNSLLLIELQSKLRQQHHISIPLIELFQGSTLRSMASLLQIEVSNPGAQVDWESETTPQAGLAPPLLLDEVRSIALPPRVVVLTGSTGFLGQYLLRALIEQKQIEKVICIAVRNFDDHDKKLLRARNFIRLCLPRKIVLHYISTTGVTAYSTSDDDFPEISVRDTPNPPPPQTNDGLHGYVASKWASEVYLENVHHEHQLPVWIHRPSSIIRPDSHLHGDSPTPDILQNLLGYSRRLNAVPIMTGMHGTLDLVAPETVADNIVRDLMASSAVQLTFRHQSGDVELSFSELREYIQRETGGDVVDIPLDEWIRRAETIGLSTAMAAVFREMARLGARLRL
ncbi:hypothetical protein ETB97_012299 [Aspergillus alliaceus]|uniref:Carrier domain-containing protein n=1 Tax=Petromyces alliaceus TaxID=209559 RepID=A0A8H6E774_PETAA|nr:hypothetical protein ETB97_012299 [Aspergillus burnettii]